MFTISNLLDLREIEREMGENRDNLGGESIEWWILVISLVQCIDPLII